jgi:predicted LPLAT superfamily acyltransferase
MNYARTSQNLSSSRGNSFGIGFFRLLLKWGGLNRACEFVWFIALFYALFDRRARSSAMPYLRHRFPDAGFFHLWFYSYRLMVNQGQSLLLAAAADNGIEYPVSLENDSAFMDLIGSGRGFILLISHTGPWQAAMSAISDYGRNVTVLVQRDQNINVDKMMAVKSRGQKINVIFTDDFTGGVFDAMVAVERGDVVCIMGDRCREKEGSLVDFLGEPARFPVAAFYLASKCACPIVPMFVFRNGKHERLLIHFGEQLCPEANTLRRRSRESLRPYITAYVADLEAASQRFPFQCYIFEDIWGVAQTGRSQGPPAG